jgi:tetratricopeptide (TPR) repeat protein
MRKAVLVQEEVRKSSLKAQEVLRAIISWTEEVTVEDNALLRAGRVDLGSTNDGLSELCHEQLRKSTVPQYIPEKADTMIDSSAEFQACASARLSQRTACERTSHTLTDHALRSIKSGNWMDAEVNCNRALKLDWRCTKVTCPPLNWSKYFTTKMPQAYQQRGICRRQLGKLIQSLSDFERALRLKPQSYALGKERRRSRSAFEEAENLRPSAMHVVTMKNLMSC